MTKAQMVALLEPLVHEQQYSEFYHERRYAAIRRDGEFVPVSDGETAMFRLVVDVRRETVAIFGVPVWQVDAYGQRANQKPLFPGGSADSQQLREELLALALSQITGIGTGDDQITWQEATLSVTVRRRLTPAEMDRLGEWDPKEWVAPAASTEVAG